MKYVNKFVKPLKMAQPITLTNRKLHQLASGNLKTLDKSKLLKGNGPKTMVSTLNKREEVEDELGAEQLDDLEEWLRENDHDVAYGIDATKLDDTSDPAISDMYDRAKAKGIDMSEASYSFLRSGTEKESDDQSLLGGVAASLAKSGVDTVHATYSSMPKDPKTGRYNAPGRQNTLDAFAPYFDETSTSVSDKPTPVESVHNKVFNLKPGVAQTSTLTKNKDGDN